MVNASDENCAHWLRCLRIAADTLCHYRSNESDENRAHWSFCLLRACESGYEHCTMMSGYVLMNRSKTNVTFNDCFVRSYLCVPSVSWCAASHDWCICWMRIRIIMDRIRALSDGERLRINELFKDAASRFMMVCKASYAVHVPLMNYKTLPIH
jgi:hypothetical protein